METSTYVITGAAGHTGRVVAATLLRHNKPVRVIGRHLDKLQPLVDEGAEVALGDLGDRDFLTRAFRGAHAVYTIIPPNMIAPSLRAYQREVGETIAHALRVNDVRYVVNLSSLGADLASRVGPVTGLHDQEQRLNKLSETHVLHLRPTYFMENLLGSIDMIRSMEALGGVIGGDVAFPMIATRDIGEVAAQALLDLGFRAHTVRELRGPADVSMSMAANLIARALDKPHMRYVQWAPEDVEKALIAMGMSVDVARSFVELQQAIGAGVGITASPRSRESTTKTTLEMWLRDVFVPAYEAASQRLAAE